MTSTRLISPRLCFNLLLVSPALIASGSAVAQSPAVSTASGGSVPYECMDRTPSEMMREYEERIASGSLPDPRKRALPTLPAIAPSSAFGSQQGLSGPSPCMSPGQILLFEDTAGVLAAPNGVLDDPTKYALFTQIANQILATHGDQFDFVNFWVNYATPPIGGAAGNYLPVSNNVNGIGDAYGNGQPTYDLHAQLGLAGSRIQGFMLFTKIGRPMWEAGNSGQYTDGTRLIINHEFLHRFGVFLPPVAGFDMQGTQPCGAPIHWNWRVDGQSSCMGISEWVGSNPATLAGGNGFQHLAFNTDIPGGVYSYPDLYLMGMVSAAELDQFTSELRYMPSATCSGGASFPGAGAPFTSADIIAAAGPRSPDSTASQKNFRTAWVALHLPGSPPTQAELEKMVGILEQQSIDFNYSTLGRGTTNHAIYPTCPDGTAFCAGDGTGTPCPCNNGAAGAGCANSASTGAVLTGYGAPDTAGDSFVLTVADSTPGTPGLLFQGTAALGGGAGLQVGNGLFCIGSQRRWSVLVADDTGQASYGPALLGSDPAAVPGATLLYQWWYRDNADPCGGGFNFSNAWSATWQ